MPCVANAGLLIHDGVGKYVLPSNHSVLVLSDRCQLVVMGKHVSAWCVRDCRQTSRVPVGPSDWSPKCGASEDATDGVASLLDRGLGLERPRDVSKDRRVLICERR